MLSRFRSASGPCGEQPWSRFHDRPLPVHNDMMPAKTVTALVLQATALLSAVSISEWTTSIFAESHASIVAATGKYAVVDMLVFGADLSIEETGYPPNVKAAITRYRRRWNAHRSRRVRPSSELQMVYLAQVRYERRLVAAATEDGRTAQLALDYVDRLQPCYEWEGGHECPEREAMFATAYQAAHPDGPFREYLPLLAAHRWLCASEAYESERRPEDALRARHEYELAIASPGRASNVLIRAAARELKLRNRCFGES